MKLRNTLLPPFIAVAILGPSPAMATMATSEAFLNIDGKVRVHGAPLEGTRVVVFHEGRMSQVLTNDVSHITMRLDLQSSYLLSFEREGCITKQLLFDTHVPANAPAGGPFDFPFKVTLEAMPAHSTMQYVGPVGLIRYDNPKADFDHDSKYTLIELKQLLEATVEAVAEAPVLLRERLPKMEILPIPARGAFGKSVADRALSAGTPAMAGAPDDPLPMHTNTGGSARREVVAMTAAAAPVAVSPARPAQAYPMRVVDKRALKNSAATADGRSMEVLEEKLRVTTVVRLTVSGRTNEFKRVAHRYGQVYFFRNGNSCSEAVYAAGIAQ